VTSAHKIRSNRANARSSTGPKTPKGRGRSAKNALRYGLILPVDSDPTLSQEVAALARQIVGADATPEMQEMARHIAEAQVDLRRVRVLRHDPRLDYSEVLPMRGCSGGGGEISLLKTCGAG
jgi:hypothetical protein